MNLGAIFDNPLLFFGRNHLDYYISLMIIVAKIIKAPFFYVAVGSQANIEVQHPPQLLQHSVHFSTSRSSFSCFRIRSRNLWSLCMWFIVTLYIYGYYLTNSIIKHKPIIGDLRV
jgi:hypothetical protein